MSDTETQAPTKKGLSFPSAYTVLFAVAAIVALLTWVVDAGYITNCRIRAISLKLPMLMAPLQIYPRRKTVSIVSVLKRT